MTIEEKKVAVLVWLATDIFAQAPNNTDAYIIKRMVERYPDLSNDQFFPNNVLSILDELILEGNVRKQIRSGQTWYEATLKGKDYAKQLLDKKDVLKYIRIAGVVKNELTPTEMLDKVLLWFSMDINEVMEEQFTDTRDRKNRRFVTQHDAAVAIVNHFYKGGYKELNSVDFTFYYPMILEKLVKDGYITHDPQSNYYSQNLEGVIFSKNGGYTGEIIRNNMEERRVREFHNLTIALTFGTVWGAIWVCFQMFDFYQDYNWNWQLGAAFCIGFLLAGTIAAGYLLSVKKIRANKQIV